MTNVSLFKQDGSQAGDITLNDAVFGIEPNESVVFDVILSQRASLRQGTHAVKNRSAVRGGGKKPWRQKGTGRARQGSIRSPQWRGGGVVFGPRGNENYTKSLSKTAKRVAVKQALTLASEAKKIAIDDIKTTGKTAEVAKYLADNKLNRKVLVVVSEKTPELMRASNNIQNVLVVSANYLSVYHILNADHIVLSAKAVPVLESWLVGGKA